MARPRIEIDQDSFKKLCGLQCTLSEIASFFNCSEDTVERWCKRELKSDFAEIYKKFSGAGKISLRRWQFKMAEHNTSMAIWLGKQYLGQKDFVETTAPGTESAIEKIAKMVVFGESEKNQKNFQKSIDNSEE